MNEKTKYMNISKVTAIWEYLVCMFVLFFVCVNYVG